MEFPIPWPILLNAAIIILSVSWALSGLFGAPWVPTPLRTVDKMLRLTGLKEGQTLLDLGAGDGRIVIWAAWRYKANAVGVEIDPLRCLWANFWIRVLGLGHRARVQYGDIYDTDLIASADVITMYLLQSTNRRLESRLAQECKPGVRILSRVFTLPRFEAVLQVREKELSIYRL